MRNFLIYFNYDIINVEKNLLYSKIKTGPSNYFNQIQLKFFTIKEVNIFFLNN